MTNNQKEIQELKAEIEFLKNDTQYDIDEEHHILRMAILKKKKNKLKLLLNVMAR